MIDKLELHHLRLLGALYDRATLSAAAEKLGITQQAASLQLKRIRELLGDPLFVRTGHGMAPTAHARQIRGQVEQVLALVHAIPRAGELSLQDLERTLHICATDHAQRVVLSQLLPVLRQAAPRVRVQVSNIEAAGLARKMQLGEVTLALTSNAYVPEGLRTLPLFTERYVCVAGQPQGTPEKRVPLAEIVRRDFLVVSPGVAGFEGSAGAWFEQQRLKRRAVLSVPSFFMAQEFLRGSDLVAFLPSRLLPCEGLHEVPLEKLPPGYEVVAAWHPAGEGDALLQRVLDQLRAAFHPSSAEGL